MKLLIFVPVIIGLFVVSCTETEDVSLSNSMERSSQIDCDTESFRRQLTENLDGLREVVRQNKIEDERLLLDSFTGLSEVERKRMLDREYEDLESRLDQAQTEFIREANRKILHGETDRQSAYFLKRSIIEKYQLNQWTESKGRKRFANYLDSVLRSK